MFSYTQPSFIKREETARENCFPEFEICIHFVIVRGDWFDQFYYLGYLSSSYYFFVFNVLTQEVHI